MALAIAASTFLLGLLVVWPLLEYAVHAWLSHRWRTFVAPLHGQHHHDPRRVFTSPAAWVPISLLVYGAVALAAGAAAAAGLVAGLVLGFLRYEWIHWRLHFREPRGARERLLRAHHLAHHFVNARAYHGVTTRLLDDLLGTLPASWEADYARVADRPPMTGASNFRAAYLELRITRASAPTR